jgi:hypothetical protein
VQCYAGYHCQLTIQHPVDKLNVKPR